MRVIGRREGNAKVNVNIFFVFNTDCTQVNQWT